jgi:hypothetical protein
MTNPFNDDIIPSFTVLKAKVAPAARLKKAARI